MNKHLCTKKKKIRKNTLKSKDKSDAVIKEYNLAIPKQIKGIPYDIKSIKNRMRERFFAKKTFLINMQLRNGRHTTFMVSTKNQYFKYMGAAYIIDTNLMYDNLSARHYCLDYHQDFALPIQRKINFKEVQEAIEASGMYDIESSTNPTALAKILEANMGEGVAKASAVPDFIKQMKLLLIIGTMASVILLLLFVFKTGMLQGVKIPGLS